MKKILLILIQLFSLQATILFASQPTKELALNIEFNSTPNGVFYEEPLHFNKSIKINSTINTNNIVMTQSKMINNFPVTLVMLAKPVAMNNNQVTLQFILMSYGFKQGASIITEPKLILTNGRAGEISLKDSAKNGFDLKVEAKWSEK